MSSPTSTSDSIENFDTKLYNILQNNFYHGSISDKEIISTVLEYLKSEQEECGYDEYYNYVYYEMKSKFKIDVSDETYRQLKRKHLEVDDEELFNETEHDVINIFLNHTSATSFIENE
jgi:hypothetical protein